MIHVGDRIRSTEDGWSGTVTNLIYGNDQDVPGAAVIQLDERVAGKSWFTLDLSDVTIVPFLMN